MKSRTKSVLSADIERADKSKNLEFVVLERKEKTMEAYKTRMIIEYRELKDRTEKLAEMLDWWDKGTLDFTPTCPRYLLEKQLDAMRDYVGILQTRAKIEGVDLTGEMYVLADK